MCDPLSVSKSSGSYPRVVLLFLSLLTHRFLSLLLVCYFCSWSLAPLGTDVTYNSQQQQQQVFCGLIFLSVLFFGLAFFVGVPLLAARPQKFALSFTCGSLIFMMSFGILKGPVEHLMSMLQPDRLPFTFFYLLSMFLTLHFTFSFGGASGYLLVLGSSGMQLLALVWYLISFLPGGATGLTYVFAAISHLLKPVLVACARCQAACFARCVGWMAQRATSG